MGALFDNALLQCNIITAHRTTLCNSICQFVYASADRREGNKTCIINYCTVEFKISFLLLL